MERLKGTNKVTSNVIDGICSDQGIAINFPDIYETYIIVWIIRILIL